MVFRENGRKMPEQRRVCIPSRVHVVAPVLETSPAGQAVQGGVPVLLKELLAQRPVSPGQVYQCVFSDRRW